MLQGLLMRDILLLTETPRAVAALSYCAALAKRFDAAITGMHVCERAAVPLDSSPPAAASMLTAMVQERLAHARSAVDELQRWAVHAGIARSSWQIAQGAVPETLAMAGNWHDVMVLERDDGTCWGTVNAVGELLLTTGMPVIAVPAGAGVDASLECIAVAWNGSPESTRALHAAMPLLRQAKRIVLLRGERRVPFSALVDPPRFDAGSYLERHGLDFEQVVLEHVDAHIGEDILQKTIAVRADLLVMGAYGRNRFSEWLLGGATRLVLREARVPVFLRH